MKVSTVLLKLACGMYLIIDRLFLKAYYLITTEQILTQFTSCLSLQTHNPDNKCYFTKPNLITAIDLILIVACDTLF